MGGSSDGKPACLAGGNHTVKIGDNVITRILPGSPTPWRGRIVAEFPEALRGPTLFKIRIDDETVRDKPFYLLRDEDELELDTQ